MVTQSHYFDLIDRLSTACRLASKVPPFWLVVPLLGTTWSSDWRTAERQGAQRRGGQATTKQDSSEAHNTCETQKQGAQTTHAHNATKQGMCGLVILGPPCTLQSAPPNSELRLSRGTAKRVRTSVHHGLQGHHASKTSEALARCKTPSCTVCFHCLSSSRRNPFWHRQEVVGKSLESSMLHRIFSVPA